MKQNLVPPIVQSIGLLLALLERYCAGTPDWVFRFYRTDGRAHRACACCTVKTLNEKLNAIFGALDISGPVLFYARDHPGSGLADARDASKWHDLADLRRVLPSACASNPAEYRPVHQAGAAGIIEIKDAANQFARREQTRDQHAVVSMTRALVSILRPPKVKVSPQVTAYASKGGWSIVFAQFDFGMVSPCVPRPSFTFGSKGTSVMTAPL